MKKSLFKSLTQVNRIAIYLCVAFVAALGACKSSNSVISFYCQDREVEIYVNDQYLGRDIVKYSVGKSQEYIDVTGYENGIQVYHRRINVKDNAGSLIEIQIQRNYRYSD